MGLSLLINSISEPFRIYERWPCNDAVATKKTAQNPVFILGHWRSGTTYLHNLICQDLQTAYVTTYHGTFPEILLNRVGRLIFTK